MSMAQDHVSWRAGTPWWVTGIEAVVLILVGLFLLLQPESAAGLIIQIIALILLIESILHIAAEVRRPRGEADPWGMLQAGIGATVGVLLVLRDWILPQIDAESVRNILGFGLIAYAIVGAIGALVMRDEGEAWHRPIVNALLLIVLAVLLLTSGETNAVDRLGLLGWVALIGGAILLFLAWRAYNRPRAVDGAGSF
jgi:uncharacterized membrane protein HdeD (DUF308 family)